MKEIVEKDYEEHRQRNNAINGTMAPIESDGELADEAKIEAKKMLNARQSHDFQMSIDAKREDEEATERKAEDDDDSFFQVASGGGATESKQWVPYQSSSEGESGDEFQMKESSSFNGKLSSDLRATL